MTSLQSIAWHVCNPIKSVIYLFYTVELYLTDVFKDICLKDIFLHSRSFCNELRYSAKVKLLNLTTSNIPAPLFNVETVKSNSEVAKITVGVV